MELDIAKKKAIALATAKFKVKQKGQSEAMSQLASGPSMAKREDVSYGVKGKRTQKAQKPDQLSFYEENVPKALMVPSESVDLKQAAPFGLRAKLDFLPTMSDKVQALEGKFGKENVKSLNVSGKQNVLYKDGGKWRFVDLPFGVEFSDVTADLAGDIAPTVASVAAAVPSAISSPAGMALAGSAAYAGVGTAQDIAARKAWGIETNKAEAVKRRGVEAMFGAGMDYGLMKGVGFLAKGALGKEGIDLASQQLKSIEDQIKLPAVMRQGEDGIQKVVDSATVYKDGTAAKFLEGVRDQINWEFSGEMVDPEPIIKKFATEHVSKIDKEVKSLAEQLKELSAKRESLQGSIPSSTEIKNKAKKEAVEVFNSILQKETKKVAVKQAEPKAKLGQKFQDMVSENFVKVEATKINKYENALELLKDVKVPSSKVQKVFNNQVRGSVVDAENEIISILATPAQKLSNIATLKLDDVMSGELSFKQLNDIVKIAESKSGAAKRGANVNEAAFAGLTKDLKALRDKVLDSSSKEAKDAFNDSQKYFKEVALKYRKGGVATAIEEAAGANYNKAISDFRSGKPFTLPERSADPSVLLNKAISNPTEIKNFLRATGDSLEAKKILREEFLASRGIVADSPIPKKAFDFTREDKDVIDALWPRKEKGGFNRKYQTLKKIQQLAKSEDEFVENLSSETISKIVSQNVEVTERQIAKIAQQEKVVADKQKELTSELLVKMWGKGEIPLPTNQTTMETFVKGIRGAKQVEQEKMLLLLKEQGKSEMFERAVINDLVSRVKTSKAKPQEGSNGAIMWNQGEMKTVLDRDRQFLKRFLGEDKYKNLVKWNNALNWVSVGRDTSRGVRVGAAGSSPEKVSWFFSNLIEPVANRFKAAIIYTQLKSPIPTKIVMSPEQYNKWIERVIQSTFVTGQGVEAIMNEAEADPAFKSWATEFYKDALK